MASVKLHKDFRWVIREEEEGHREPKGRLPRVQAGDVNDITRREGIYLFKS